jgi:hypothetical protein
MNLSATNPAKQQYILGQAYTGGKKPDFNMPVTNVSPAAFVPKNQPAFSGTGSGNQGPSLDTMKQQLTQAQNSLGAAQAAGGSTVPPDTGTANNNTPAAPVKTPADTAFEQYLQSLQPSSATTEAQTYLNKLTSQSQMANEKAMQSGETLGFASGEAQRVGRNFDLMIGGAAKAAEALASLDANRSKIGEARYNYEKAKIDQQAADTKYQAEQARLGQFELSPGQQRFDAQGNVIAGLAPTPKAPTIPKGTINSGSLSYSPTAQSEDSQALEYTRNPDTGYVDSAKYKELYDMWIKNKGLRGDFLSTFDPRDYVDPNDTSLPSFLRPKAGADSGTEALKAWAESLVQQQQ